MLDKNFIFQALSMATSFICIPIVISTYGTENYGVYGTLISYCTLCSVLLSLKLEVNLSACSDVPFSNNKLFISLVVWGTLSLFVGIIIWLAYRFDLGYWPGVPQQYLPSIVLASSALGLFAIVNYGLIVSNRYFYTQLQVIKNVLLFGLLLSIPMLTVDWMMNSFILSIIICSVIGLIVIARTGKLPFVTNLDGTKQMIANSVPFMVSGLMVTGRETLIATFILLEYGEAGAGLYFFCSLYMTRAFQTYSTLQANRLRYTCLNRKNLLAYTIKSNVKLSLLVVATGFVGYLVLREQIINIGLNESVLGALLPITLAYLFIMPFIAIYEIFQKSILNLYFNVFLLVCLLALVGGFNYLGGSLISFLLSYSCLFFVVYLVQAIAIIPSIKIYLRGNKNESI